MTVKPGFLVVVAGIGLFFGVRYLYQSGEIDSFVPRAVQQPSSVGPKAVLPDLPSGSAGDQSTVTSPPAVAVGGGSAASTGAEIRFEQWVWMTQFAFNLANGGVYTTADSLMAKRGINLKVVRQDDTEQMKADLVAFASELAKGNPQPKSGVHYVVIMGDQAAAFFKSINPQLKKICPECYAQVVGVLGRSNGEDKCMMRPEVLQDKQKMRGALIAGAIKEGDWNICVKLAFDNNIPNNPDVTTYDPNAINWVNATYVDAADKYVAGYSETRAVVENGKRTGKKITKEVDGVATWTPEDIKVAKNRGGLVSVASTRSQGYRSQMPAIVIGIKKWMQSNRPSVEGMLEASFEAADQINGSKAILKRAAALSNKIWNEKQSPEWWVKYFDGTVETDKQGLKVELGGSSVANLADNIQWFGLAPGSVNLFGITYKVFGDIVVSQYPNDVPDYPPLSEVLDTSYVKNIVSRTTQMASADLPSYSVDDKVTSVVSRKAVHINFETGKATLTSAALAQLEEIFNQAVLTGLVVEVEGHTDNTGSRETNLSLARARANAVKKYLEEKSSVNFPAGRVRVKGFGPDKPVASNSTEVGRAQNRRVEIILGSTE